MLLLICLFISDRMSCGRGPDDFIRRPSVFYSTLESVGISYQGESRELLGEAPGPPAGCWRRRFCLLAGATFLLAGVLAMAWWIFNNARIGQQTN